MRKSNESCASVNPFAAIHERSQAANTQLTHMGLAQTLVFPTHRVYGSHMTHPGPAIRAMREAQGLTLRQLADLSGTSFSYLAGVERQKRKPTDRWLRDVTDALAKHMLAKGAA